MLLKIIIGIKPEFYNELENFATIFKTSNNFSIFLGHGKATAAMTRKPSKKE